MDNDETGFDELLRSYRSACPDVEPSANFLPGIWQKIDARHNFWFVFRGVARTAVAASAVVMLVLLALNLVPPANTHISAPTYADALMADHSAENTYYAEAIRSTPVANHRIYPGER